VAWNSLDPGLNSFLCQLPPNPLPKIFCVLSRLWCIKSGVCPFYPGPTWLYHIEIWRIPGPKKLHHRRIHVYLFIVLMLLRRCAILYHNGIWSGLIAVEGERNEFGTDNNLRYIVRNEIEKLVSCFDYILVPIPFDASTTVAQSFSMSLVPFPLRSLTSSTNTTSFFLSQ
jgi:hypothetical protein